MEEKPSYYAIIPASIRYDDSLTASEKLFYGEITALTYKTGECWATNTYFANLYGVSTRSITSWIAHLERRGYIQTENFYRENTKEIEKRVLKIPLENNFYTYGNKFLEGYRKNIQEGIEKNFQENNTSINNIKRKYFESEELNNVFLDWLEYKKERKETYKEIGLKSLITQINKQVEKYNEETIINLIIECMASNYKGIIFDKLTKNKTDYKKHSVEPEWLDKEYVEEEMSDETKYWLNYVNGKDKK